MSHALKWRSNCFVAYRVRHMGIWESTVGKILVSVSGGMLLALVILLAKRSWARLRLKKAFVEIELSSNDTMPASSKFSLLHVRNGKDQVDGRGPIINRVAPFKLRNGNRSIWSAKITSDPRLGLQFKCYADVPETEVENLERWLSKRGFEDIYRDNLRKGRVLFLLPLHEKYTTTDGYINNFGNPHLASIRVRVPSPDQ